MSVTHAHIYALLDTEGRPRYIGESTDVEARRMWHWYNRRYDSGNMPLKLWLRSLDAPPEAVVLDAVSFDGRFAQEEFLTICFRWAGCDLLNMNDGIKPGTETRARMSAAKTPEIRARISQRMKEHWAAKRLASVAS